MFMPYYYKSPNTLTNQGTHNLSLNNVQEDEPQPTALEKQVQVLTTAIERLTRQN